MGRSKYNYTVGHSDKELDKEIKRAVKKSKTKRNRLLLMSIKKELGYEDTAD